MRKKGSGIIRTVYRHVKLFLKKSYKDNIAALSGQSAFFLILSFVPLLMFVFALFLIVTGRTLNDSSVLSQIDTTDPILITIKDYIFEAAQRATSGTVIITAVMALWSAGRGLYCITEGISRIYRLPNKHIWLMKRVFAMGYTVVMLLMLIAGFIVFFVNILVSRTFEQIFGENIFLQWLARLLNPVVFGALQVIIMTLALKLFLRKKLTDKRYYSFRALFPGMFFTVIAWYVLSYGVSLYIRYFSASSIYGSLGTLAIIMIWIYFMMFILLYGIQLDYIYREVFSRIGKKKEIMGK